MAAGRGFNEVFQECRARRVAKVSIGVFVEPQILLNTGGALTRGPGHDLPEIFSNLGSQKPHFLHFETHFSPGGGGGGTRVY